LTQEALGLNLVKHLMQRVIALEARLLPQADGDAVADGGDSSCCSKVSSGHRGPAPKPASQAASHAADAVVRAKPVQPQCMTAAHKPCATSLSLRHVRAASLRQALLGIEDVGRLNEVVVMCAKAALDGERGRAVNAVYRSSDEQEGRWQVWSASQRWKEVDDVGLCQHLYVGVLWALRDVLRVLQGDAVAGADLAVALVQKEYDMALSTPACPGVHKMRLEWLIPLLTQGICNG
jgi:hypothetical protein